jgi:hypothetical protein
VQRAAGCIVGEDYPERMVDHEVARVANMSRMKMAHAGGRGGGTYIHKVKSSIIEHLNRYICN